MSELRTSLRADTPSLAGGLLLIVCLALISRLLADRLGQLPGVVIALLLGIALANTIPLANRIESSTRFTSHHLLQAAIILLGAGVSTSSLTKTGVSTLSIVALCIGFGLVASVTIGYLLRFPGQSRFLVAVGTAICGTTAILVCSRLLRAKEREVTFSIAILTLFNLFAVLIYPLVGRLFHLSDSSFAIWAATSINDTSSVLGAGSAFSYPALTTATVVKASRTLFLVPLAIIIGLSSPAEATGSLHRRILGAVPWFLAGFLAFAILNTTGLLSSKARIIAQETSAFLIVMVMAAIGLRTQLREVFSLGVQPLFFGLSIAAALSAFSFAMVSVRD